MSHNAQVETTPKVSYLPIHVENLEVHYQGKVALEDISLDIQPGKITGIIGPNGAGKSTLVKGLLGLVKSASGRATVGKQNLLDMRKTIAYVEQRSNSDLTFPITVEDVVLLGTYPGLGLFHRPGKKEKELVKECLEAVKMTEFHDRQIGELSGGQLQRVFIARALAQKADIIFLDEPFVGIDMVSEKVIVDILKVLKEKGKTIVIVHHDLAKVTTYFDELIILNRKLIASGPVTEIFTTEKIQEAYGSSLGDIRIKGVESND